MVRVRFWSRNLRLRRSWCDCLAQGFAFQPLSSLSWWDSRLWVFSTQSSRTSFQFLLKWITKIWFPWHVCFHALDKVDLHRCWNLKWPMSPVRYILHCFSKLALLLQIFLYYDQFYLNQRELHAIRPFPNDKFSFEELSFNQIILQSCCV